MPAAPLSGHAMGSSQTTDAAAVEPVISRPVPAFVDWLVAALLALSGLALIVGGSALVFVVDRPLVVEGVADGSIDAAGLTDAQAVELTLAVATWTGAGLLVTGVLLVAAAVAYAVYRRRSRRAAARGDRVDYYWANAVLGAIVSALLSFVPFSPALGGAAAGYLERGESERTTSVGALSGLLTMAPALVVLVFVLGGLASGLSAAGEAGLAVVAGTGMLLVLMVVAVVGAGLGAIGGFVGGQLAGGRASE